jgi:hypothetical protein
VVHADGGEGRIVQVTDRVKGDPFAVIGYVKSLEASAKLFLESQVKRPIE